LIPEGEVLSSPNTVFREKASDRDSPYYFFSLLAPDCSVFLLLRQVYFFCNQGPAESSLTENPLFSHPFKGMLLFEFLLFLVNPGRHSLFSAGIVAVLVDGLKFNLTKVCLHAKFHLVCYALFFF